MTETVVRNPRDCVPLIQSYGKKEQEHFGVVLLDGARKVIGKKCLFIGGTNKCMVDKKVIFWEIVRKKPCAIVLFHNHPSGTESPSIYDIETTKELQKGCELLGIQLLDHIIITKYRYYSFLENDMLELSEDKALVAEV